MKFYLLDVKSTVNIKGKEVAFDYINTYLDSSAAIAEAKRLSKFTNVLDVSVHTWILDENGNQEHSEGNDSVIYHYQKGNYPTVKFKGFGEVPLEPKIRSIFDENIAGLITNDGSYYLIHRDHISREKYALSKANHRKAMKLGHTLGEGEVRIFNGEKVRGMTYEEERKWDRFELDAHVDLWGNIKVEER